ncbi:MULTISPECIES: hypothetical protein [unclassified Mesorhizobium]|uniref:hypothetical protein n=1 Tax=unclassified Mesorhizobium TaxID=325217 RepID=UPI000FDA6644|nr:MULTISPECIES: hypothetical protein [unclassified Mesorhizobium]TGR23139.1 hypothetical protein EN840_22040 [Mesorhizobium sp. M8A.F.Ca.ET.197.01.1.1]TGR39224.1 hypothetical protein EN842_42085 [bacterium M00.F.Ca.ET.199.01.1.1]TGR46818.1 hypothetical protein EN841_22035 [Mesorhizobium sp. M8A.F.Ca.ET.198.01.1.1]TGV85104.1 hypothetical protein EN792_018435 [Mesorhizobium sp. M00.F.Ca.ET.149.01.1.1]
MHVPNARIDFTVSEVHPFGAPDPGKPSDTTQTTAFSKICSIKAKETQIAEGKPSILWIDFRDLGKWADVLKEEQGSPLISGHHGTLCSGAIWYGFYGWKDAPVFDDHIGGGQSITPMAHFGRFSREAQKVSRYSAAILCLGEASILFENPAAAAPLSGEQRAALTRLPWFNLEHSVADWQRGDIDGAYALARTMIEALRKDRSAP